MAAQAYVRNVALSLEASRESTGSPGLNVTDCTQGFGDKPPSI
ncbi:MAG: prepilin-type N-terminal cleavage/methylation domain-containing protein, partial [Thermaceae bacterium]